MNGTEGQRKEEGTILTTGGEKRNKTESDNDLFQECLIDL
jgi:hypothetical protein